jgi:pilus assembly protein CpaB
MEGNEPVLESKLAPKNAGAGLMTAIPEGMRAVSVKVNDVIGVAGFVVPGAHVDVILTGNPTPNGDMQASKIFLRNVEVLAAGQNVDRDSEGKPLNVQVITLLVSPEDSEKLALVTTEGRIHLALRNPLDKNDDDTRLIQKAELYGALPTHPFFAAPQPPAAPVKVASTGTGTGKPAAPKQQAVTPAPPAPAVPVTAPKVEAPKPPQVVEIQLIQGNTSQKFKFDVKPQD